MANSNILSEFGATDVDGFHKDFDYVIKVGAEIDRYYGEAQRDLDGMLPRYEKLLEHFNRKYKGISIKPKKAIEHFNIRIFLKAAGIKEFFADSASRIPGLKSLGRTNFNQIDVADAEKFARFLDTLLDKIFISYADAESGTSTIAAVYDRNKKMIELVYNPVEILSENSAGFKICAYYALKDGYNKKIDVSEKTATFGFYNMPNELERREFYDKFDPRVLE